VISTLFNTGQRSETVEAQLTGFERINSSQDNKGTFNCCCCCCFLGVRTHRGCISTAR